MNGKIHQCRFWNADIRQFFYSGGTPKMMESFFNSIAPAFAQGKGTLTYETGLTDDNSLDIYEGDLIAVWEIFGEKGERQIFEVEWGGEEYPGFDLKGWPNDEVNGLSELAQSGDWGYEVVGNIFTSPKIITEGSK